MARVVVKAPDEITLERVPVPRPRDGEVLVSTLVAGVCGSDTHAAQGRHPFITLPYNPGHEVVGVVEQTGPGVRSVHVGQRVTVEPTLVCGQCKQCLQGRENICETLQFFGCGYDQGGMAEFFTIPASRLHIVPEGFTDQQAALIEPLSTPVHAVRLASPGAGDLTGRTVVIIGAGTIGLLILAAARHRNAKRVVMTDMLASKRERARRLGADSVLDARHEALVEAVRSELGESADVVFDCVANETTLNQAIGMAVKGGTVVVVGIPTRDMALPLPLVQDQQIRVQGSATYLPEDFRDAMEIIASGSFHAEDYVTAIYPLDQAAAAFAASAGGEHVKVLVASGRHDGLLVDGAAAADMTR